MIRPGKTYRRRGRMFVAGVPSTPDSVSAGLYRNDVLDATVIVTPTLMSSGLYSFSWTIPGTYAATDTVYVEAVATKDGLDYPLDIFTSDGDSNVVAGDGMDLVDVPNATGMQAIAAVVWDFATSAITTVGSIGKLLVDRIDAAISTRMPTSHIAATDGTVDRVALVDTTTSNTDMRGTDGANTTTPPTVGQIRAEMETNGGKLGVLSADWLDDGRLDVLLDAAAGGGGGGGSGAGAFTIDDLVIKRTDGITVIPACDVIFTTSSASSSTNVAAAVVTDVNGKVPPIYVDEGTYYIWREKFGVSFSNPLTMVVDDAGGYTIT